MVISFLAIKITLRRLVNGKIKLKITNYFIIKIHLPILYLLLLLFLGVFRLLLNLHGFNGI